MATAEDWPRPVEFVDPAGYVEITSPAIDADEVRLDNVDLSQPVIDEADLDQAEFVELAPATDPRHASGLGDFWGYRWGSNTINWIVGNQFGLFSIESNHYQHGGFQSGFGLGVNIAWINGPVQTEMPPRLYDFSVAYQIRDQFGPLACDVAASAMASSDFEGSSREGIRYPAHAVGFLQVNPRAQLAFGVDYLDRADIKLLPVAGLVWVPCDTVRLDLVFPRPRATFALSDETWLNRPDLDDDCIGAAIRHRKAHRLYVAGELGGGTWAIERGMVNDDLATYRDLRVCVGLEWIDDDGSRSAFEIGYLFARRLEFTSGDGNMNLADTAMISWGSSY